MAKKKRREGPKRPKPFPAALPDRRALEGTMHQVIAGLRGEADQDTPLGKAQALMYQAFEERDEPLRVQRAKEALEICPDCADAYVLLAEHAGSHKEARALYERGVAAGKRALGPEAFQRAVGHFWGVLETRPYMRARLGLAHALWNAGRRDEAVGHLQDMLRLNPNDNQGVRYTLAGFLLFLDRDDDLARLLQQYDESSATWAYTKALLAFRRDGNTIDARRLLKTARLANKYVPAYLTGQKFPGFRPPAAYSPGDESEALIYLGSFLHAWRFTAGAVAWLRQNSQLKKRKADPPHPKGPLGFIKKWLKDRLPQEADVWQAGSRQMPKWIRLAGEPVRPWIILVVNPSNGMVLAHQMPEEAPSPALLWDTLVQAMQHPAAGKAQRPAEIQVRPHEAWESLQPHCEEIGVPLVVTEGLDPFEAVFMELIDKVCGQPEPGLLDMPGITPGQGSTFYEAAAFFFQQAPWKKVGYEAAIKVECTQFQSGPWYAVVMGQSGLTLGLALYDSLETLARLWSGGLAGKDQARQTVGTSVTFGEAWDLPVTDLEAATRHAWKVARPDAYPSIFRKERGLTSRPPLAWELDLMTACLQALPGFVQRHQQDDPAREETVVPVASGELKLTLSWVGEELAG